MGVAAVLAVVALLALLGAGVALGASTGSPRDEEVLPAHYGSLLQCDPTHYPGHCPSCGTDNEPGYRFCEACGSAIPTAEHAPSDADLRWIVER